MTAVFYAKEAQIMRKSNRPLIDIQRIPVGEKPLEELVAEVYGWIFDNRSRAKSSADTFVNPANPHYNDGTKMISGGNKDDTAA